MYVWKLKLVKIFKTCVEFESGVDSYVAKNIFEL